jgi:5'-nucleotidase
LPFANTLTEIDMTGQEIINALEDGVDYALSGSTGAYPYATGLRWDVDLSKPKGQRFSNVQINPRVKGTWQALNVSKTYKVVTNNFMAKGSDGYTTLGNIPATRKVDTYLDYALSFVNYVKQVNTLTKLPIDEYSTQRFVDQTATPQ